jgi:hypothetical protein
LVIIGALGLTTFTGGSLSNHESERWVADGCFGAASKAAAAVRKIPALGSKCTNLAGDRCCLFCYLWRHD